MKGNSSKSGTTEAVAVVKDYEFARNELAQAQDARSVTLKFCHALYYPLNYICTRCDVSKIIDVHR